MATGAGCTRPNHSGTNKNGTPHIARMLKSLAEGAQKAWREPFSRFLILLIAVAASYALAFAPTVQPVAPQQFSGNATLEVHFFYHPACMHCKEQMPYNQGLAEDYPFAKWTYHDTADPAQARLMEEMLSECGREPEGVPTTIINRTVIVGFSKESTPKMIRDALASSGAGNGTAPDGMKGNEIALPVLGTIDPSEFSLPLLAVVLGLIDGFNPCAMWVLVYLISITLTLHDRRKFFLVVGTFLLASGTLYFLIMAAWLNAFLFVGYVRPVMIGVGAIALYWGITSLREFWRNRGEIVCKVGDSGGKKRLSGEIQELLSSPLSLGMFAGLVVLAFTVNSIEFVCSSAIPAVFTQVLTLSGAGPLERYFYILLYVLMYMLDDLVVFALAFWAAGGMLGSRVASWGHAIGAVILIALGMMLLFAPGLLMG